MREFATSACSSHSVGEALALTSIKERLGVAGLCPRGATRRTPAQRTPAREAASPGPPGGSGEGKTRETQCTVLPAEGFASR